MSGALAMATPRPGDVIRYRYLWAKEAADGYEAKIARPCVVLQASPVGDRVEVVVLPLTHEPQHDSKWMTVPAEIRRQAGLDDYASYIVYSEANSFLWPSWDVIPVKERKSSALVRGRLAHGFYSGVRHVWDLQRSQGKAQIVDRAKLDEANVDQWRKRRLSRASER